MAAEAAAVPSWQIGAASPADLPALTPIWQAMMQARHHLAPAFALHCDAAARWRLAMLDLLEAKQCFVLVARPSLRHKDQGSSASQAAAVGYCSGWWDSPAPFYRAKRCGTLNELAVATAHAHRGVGQRLMAAAGLWFRQRQVPTFELSCAVENHSARRFWRLQGGKELMVRCHFDVQP